MKFSPGFRLSLLDIIVLISGIIGFVLLYQNSKESSFILAFVLGHFFLFCNVFRVSRLSELIWGSIFIVLGSLVKIFSILNWYIVGLIMLIITTLLIIIEMRRPSYHGILWKKLNPNLEIRCRGSYKT